MSAAKGIMAFTGARFVGSMEMTFTEPKAKGSAANLNNVAVLDCSVCKPTDLIEQLSWADLPLSAELPTLFCACPPSDVHGILLHAADADLTALLAIASNLTAISDSGDLTLDEFVLTATQPTTNLSGAVVGPEAPTPVVRMTSTYGDVALNGLIATSAGSKFNISLESMAGVVKGLFTGGALDGHYEVVTAPGGIGHVGIVIDNQVTSTTAGHVGKEGNASVFLKHNYGDLSLAMSTKAPSVFDGITGSLTSTSSSSLFGATAPATAPTAECAAAQSGRTTAIGGGIERIALVQRVAHGLATMGAALGAVDGELLSPQRRVQGE